MVRLALLLLLLAPARAASVTSPGFRPQEGDRASGAEQEDEGEGWADEGWGEDYGSWTEEGEAESGRFFLYKELVLSAFYSADGVVNLPPGDMDEEHAGPSPRPPGSYVGLDLVGTFTPDSSVNTGFLPDWLPLTAIDLHPRIVFDRMEMDSGLDRFEFAPQDFWARFNPGGIDRLSLQVGQFVIPFGVNPIMAPRQRFILPLEALDLGLKWDWGIGLQGPLGEYEWEAAATIGTGEAFHSSNPFRRSDRRSYLLTGRVGTPTYWDLQYGLSFLYGDLPFIRAHSLLDPDSISRWRVGLDGLYKYGTYLMTGAQLTYGQDGFTGDEELVAITMGETADVLGYRLWADWVVPELLDLRLAAQLDSVVRDLSTSGTDDTAVTFELNYSLTTETSLVLDYRQELNRSMGAENDAIYLGFIYYGK